MGVYTSPLLELLRTVAEENVEFPEGLTTGSKWYSLRERLPMLGRVARLHSINKPPRATISLVTGLEIVNSRNEPTISPHGGIALSTITGEANIWAPKVAMQLPEDSRETHFSMQPFDYPPFLPEYETAVGGLRQVLEGIQDGSLPVLHGRPTY